MKLKINIKINNLLQYWYLTDNPSWNSESWVVYDIVTILISSIIYMGLRRLLYMIVLCLIYILLKFSLFLFICNWKPTKERIILIN